MNTGILTKVGNLKFDDYIYRAIEDAQLQQDIVELNDRLEELSAKFGTDLDLGAKLSVELQQLLERLNNQLQLSTQLFGSLSTLSNSLSSTFSTISSSLSTSISTLSIEIDGLDIEQLRNLSVQLHNADVQIYNTVTSYYATQEWTRSLLDNCATQTSCFVATRLEDISTANRNTGDIAIINSDLGSGLTSKTAYCWNTDHWEAFDGNYSADNVYFNEDLALNVSFGKYGSGSGVAYSLPSAGKSLKALLIDAFSAGGQHGSKTGPTFSFSLGTYQATGEVGSTYTIPTATLTMTSQGKYQYGSVTSTASTNNTGIAVEVHNAYVESPEKGKTYNAYVMRNSNPVTCAAGTTAYTFEDESRNHVYNASATYTQGDIPLDSLGAPDAGNRIPSGTYTGTCTATFTGQRYKFWGYRLSSGEESVLDLDNLTSYDIRTGIHCAAGAPDFPSSVTIPRGTKQIIFAAPHDSWKKKIRLTHPLAGQLYFDNNDERVQNKVNVKGYNDYTAKAYDIWYLNVPSLIRAEMTYTVEWDPE